MLFSFNASDLCVKYCAVKVMQSNELHFKVTKTLKIANSKNVSYCSDKNVMADVSGRWFARFIKQHLKIGDWTTGCCYLPLYYCSSSNRQHLGKTSIQLSSSKCTCFSLVVRLFENKTSRCTESSEAWEERSVVLLVQSKLHFRRLRVVSEHNTIIVLIIKIIIKYPASVGSTGDTWS